MDHFFIQLFNLILQSTAKINWLNKTISKLLQSRIKVHPLLTLQQMDVPPLRGGTPILYYRLRSDASNTLGELTASLMALHSSSILRTDGFFCSDSSAIRTVCCSV